MRAPHPAPLVARLARSLVLGVTLAAASPALAQPAADAASPPADVAVPAAAQPDSAPAASAASAPRGPTLDGARAGVTRPVSAQQESGAALAARTGSVGQPIALMIVGGAAVVIGLLVGDTGGNLLAFGGAVVGLVGLYQYLR